MAFLGSFTASRDGSLLGFCSVSATVGGFYRAQSAKRGAAHVLSSRVFVDSVKAKAPAHLRPAGRCPAAARAYLVRKVSAVELDTLLEGERTSPVVVDFYATWCGPCVVLAQQLEQLALEYGDKVKFVKIDTDEEHQLANEMEIRGLPTMVFVSKDLKKNAIRTEGLLPSSVIRDIIESKL